MSKLRDKNIYDRNCYFEIYVHLTLFNFETPAEFLCSLVLESH